MKRIAIYGAGGLGREVLLLLQQINQAEPTWDIAGFYDDGRPPGQLINGFPILGNTDALNRYAEPVSIVIAVANPAVKRTILSRIINPTVHFPVLTHPSVVLMDTQFITIGPGTIISAGVQLTVNITIGQHVLLDRKVMVGHDTQIGDFCSLTPGVLVSGDVVVNTGVFIGTGAVLANQVTVGQDVTIGAGAVVIEDLPEQCTAVGIPARPIYVNPPPA